MLYYVHSSLELGYQTNHFSHNERKSLKMVFSEMPCNESIMKKGGN